jgi:D-alanyl-lipoteichoic acid acyltransferase DltB (MBOAT superfamily)
MLFNSYLFLFVFLPAVLAGFAVACRFGPRVACGWLVAASVAFYAANGLAFTALLLGSAMVNFVLGQRLAAGGGRWLLRVAVAGNLALLGWFKYAGFLVGPLVLPVGISFFTFTQIGYLVDSARGATGRAGVLHYLLFVTWFPHLVAGPLLHHARTIAQFRDPGTFRLREEAVAVGASVFLIGLFKKVVLADAIAPLADTAFAPGVAAGLGAGGAWAGALAYTLQIYFDFSGYSDMAIGLSRMFNIALPVNFDSPYRASSIIAFWRRWHMSLSGFLRDYVYIPLGGNRHGVLRRYGNLMATMVLAGVWHGAGWNFAAWGAWHGALLVVAHRWGWPRGMAGWALTTLAVMLGWVLFRAPDMAAAGAFYAAMAGLDGVGVAPGVRDGLVLAALSGIALLLPNVRQLMAGEILALPVRDPAAAPMRLRWRPGLVWAGACFVMLALCLLRMTQVSPFLYYQF